MSNILDSFVAVAPYINQLTNTDFSVSVCDLEKCLIYVPSEKQDHKIRSGSPHVKNSVSYESIISGKKVIRRVGSEVFGFPYIAIAIPLRDNNDKVIGSVVFTEAVDRQDLLLALADNLHDTMQQMVSITESISENSIKLKDVGESLSHITDESLKSVRDTENILGFITSISNKTNMLGLNAAIEAARLGKDGSGFMVVAEEIRSLANATNEYIKNADKIIGELRKSTSKITGRLDELLSISSNQIDINNYISILVKDINERAEKLKENAQLLSE
ncbi:Methyl-accepting chemotaxis protein (MCP) signalling domain-containing protein [Proteiniborus ethanoligenes]|uniref:Methyl-accepting chemotaxis protein (MCP) signalling domain-containing protein n=1 Tax=Proteiniborus ethanoligenes TaxID=415015 RepID=A0A1H3NTT4_9FIRM|nr:methyl-accepting chemotaxis protein [Proteiniborus ethanoligenes]SDY91865.1 Methyl-accepting chemotaxis protein (MCP) signalling domain-containing protein [Proteiniborus ethanoligenes]